MPLHDASKDGILRTAEFLRYGAPVLVLAAAAAITLVGLPRLAVGAESRLVAVALLLDFTVVAPVLVYLLLVRTRRMPWTVLVPTFVVGYSLAVVTMPASYRPIVEVAKLIAIPGEAALVTYVILRTRRVLADMPNASGDEATRFRRTARKVIGSRLPADILTTEIMVLYYAFRPRERMRNGDSLFTIHQETGYVPVLFALTLAIGVETLALHLFVRQWSATAAYVLTGLSVYAVVWLLGDFRAIVARPIRIDPGRLCLRIGLRWEADIPMDQVAGADLLPRRVPSPTRNILVSAILGSPNLRLKLDRPVEVVGMYGLRRVVDEFWLRVDDAEGLCSRIRDAAGA